MSRKGHGAGHGAGEAAPGVPLDPKALPDDASSDVASSDAARRRTRAAPAPGSPLSDDEVERLKSEAATSPPAPLTIRGQPDPAAEDEPD